MTRFLNKFLLISCGILLFPDLASAHPGHNHGLLGGLMHPFTGIDHILGMISMGIWAFNTKVKSNWFKVYICYLVGLISGGIVGLNHLFLFNVDLMIALTIAGTGLIFLKKSPIQLIIKLILTIFFSLWHGVAHGMEIPVMAHPVAYISGFIISSSLLFCVGSVLGNTLFNSQKFKNTFAYLLLFSAVGLILES